MALLIAAVVVLAVTGVSLTRGTPRWWDDAARGDEALALAFENAVLTQLSAVRPSEEGRTDRSAPWRVALSEADINAWLTHRLPGWLANQNEAFEWPRRVREIRAACENGSVHIGVQIDGSLVSIEASPQFDQRGALWLMVRAVRLGRLQLPASWVLSGVVPREALQQPEVREAIDMAMGRRPLMPEAVFPVDEARRVRLLELEPRRDRLDVAARTETGSR